MVHSLNWINRQSRCKLICCSTFESHDEQKYVYTQKFGNLDVLILAGKFTSTPCQRMLPTTAHSRADLLKLMLKINGLDLRKTQRTDQFHTLINPSSAAGSTLPRK